MRPRHVGIIPDGHRRWARREGVSIAEAYERGYSRLMDVVDWLQEEGVEYVSVYALSRENCVRRSSLELEVLKRISLRAFERMLGDPRVAGGEARVVVLGDPGLVGADVAEAARRVVEASRWGERYTLAVLYCYSHVVEEERARRGYSHVSTLILPPLDLVIRTGGYSRLSGFLPLLASYAELYVTGTLWPDFTRRDLEEALEWFSRQRRNFGR